MKSKPKKLDTAVLDRIARVGELLDEVGSEVIGNRVKRLRDNQGLSIREVADRAAISKNSIVRLEQGRGTQPVTVLKVCTVLGVHIERLAEPTGEDMVIAVAHRKKDDRWFDVADMASQPLLNLDRPLKPAERKKAVNQGATSPINLLQCRLPGGNILPSILELYQKSPVRSHIGEEFVYALSGDTVVTIGKKKHKLKEGESLTFWSAEPHSYAPANPKKVPVQILSIRVDG